jgi:hypothetical protein
MSAKRAETPRALAIAALHKRAGELETARPRPTRAAPAGAPVVSPAAPAIDINQEIARERKLRNDNAEQDIALKRSTLRRLFVFLTAETVLIFIFALFQAVHWPADFRLDNWSFNLLVGATIAQITGMLFVAVRYLFPNGASPRSDS